MSIDTEFIQRLKALDARLRSLERVELPVAGGGGFAPSDAQYLTLIANASLTNERIFTPVAPLSGADGGPGAAYSLSILGSALTRVDDTNVTLTLGGSPSSALLSATSLTLGWTGTLSTARGGTGAGSLAAAGIITGALTSGRVPYATGATTLADSAAMTFSASGDLLTLTALAATDTPLTISAHASQSVNLLDIFLASAAAGVHVTSAGFVGIGTSSPGTIFHIAGNTANMTWRFEEADSSTASAVLAFRKARGSLTAYSAVAANDNLGNINFVGHDGTNYNTSAQIKAVVVGTVASTRVPSILQFLTSTDAAPSVLTLAVTIDQGRNLIVGGGAIGSTPTRTIAVNSGTAPSSSPTDAFYLYSADYAASDAGAFIRPEISGPTIHKFVSLYEIDKTDAVTNAVTTMQILDHKSSGTAAAGFGLSTVYKLQSSTTASQTAGSIDALWNTATHASRKAELVFYAWDTAAREFMRGQGNGAAAALSFFGVAPVVRPTALTAKLTALTHTAPGTPDYAIQNLTNVGGYGFVTQDEGNTVLKTIVNIDTRVNELETKLTALGLLT